MIITAFEVVKYSVANRDFPTNVICDFIDTIELSVFDDKCLKLETYNKLISSIVDYSSVQQYELATTYNLDENVLLDGIIYSSKTNANTSSPLDTEKWEVAKKFDNDCYNDLWYKYLSKYLANKILIKAIAFNTFQASNKGLMKYIGDSTGNANVITKEFYEWKVELLDFCTLILKQMQVFMKNNETCFPEYITKECEQNNCKNTGRNRRVIWKN